MEFNQINLTTLDHANRRIIYAVLGGVVALMVMFALFNVVKGVHAFRERGSYLAKIKDLQRQAETLTDSDQSGDVFDADKAAALQRHSRQANYLIALDIFPWIDILDELEETIPGRIVLDRFLPSQDLKTIMIAGHTLSMDEITQFQDALGKSELFQSVVLENIDVGGGSSDREGSSLDGAMQFEMICVFNLKAVFPEETYGGLWVTLASAKSANSRKR